MDEKGGDINSTETYNVDLLTCHSEGIQGVWKDEGWKRGRIFFKGVLCMREENRASRGKEKNEKETKT